MRLALARTLAVSFALTLVAATPGCRRAREKGTPEQSGGEVQIQGGAVTLSNDAGTVAMGEGAKVPDDFPKAIPIYPSAKVEMAARSTRNGKLTWTLSLATGDASDHVSAFYRAGMSAFKATSQMNMGVADMAVWQNEQYDATMMIAPSDDQTTRISITVVSR